MPNIRFLIRYWLPICLWMAIIFKASGDSGSFTNSSRIIGPLVKFFFPTISDSSLHEVVVSVRKTAHVTEYAVLWLVLFRAMRGPHWLRAPWQWRKACLALVLAAGYAVSDEFHQSFVPHREASIIDVLIDTAGATAGMFSMRWINRRMLRPAIIPSAANTLPISPAGEAN